MITKENINGVVVFADKSPFEDMCFVKGVGDGFSVNIECTRGVLERAKIECADAVKANSKPWNG